MTTDQKHPESDGSGDGPLELLLREALAARADQVGAHDLRPAEPPSRRVRRLRPVHAAVLPLGLAAAVTIGLVGFGSSTVADRTKPAPAASIPAGHSAAPTPSPSPSGSPAPSPSTSTSAGPDAATDSPSATASGESSATATSSAGDAPVSAPVSLGAVQSFRGVKFRLPSGWSVVYGAPGNSTACLAAPDPDVTAGLGGCGPNGIALTVFTTSDEAAQAVDPTLSELDSQDGWAHQPYCYDPEHPHNGTASLDSYDKTAVTLPAGQAELATWQLQCADGGHFTVRRWGFSQQQVMASVQGLDPKYENVLQAVLGSLDLGSQPQPFPGGTLITTSGLGRGSQPVPDDNTKVPFSVTFTNTSAGNPDFAAVVPEVDVTDIGAGTLEEQLDDGSWISLGVSYSTGPKPNVPAFALARGASKTVNYRISFAPAANFAQLNPSLIERAWLKFPEGSTSQLGMTVTVPVPTAAK
jgi:hypothetical protein